MATLVKVVIQSAPEVCGSTKIAITSRPTAAAARTTMPRWRYALTEAQFAVLDIVTTRRRER